MKKSLNIQFYFFLLVFFAISSNSYALKEHRIQTDLAAKMSYDILFVKCISKEVIKNPENGIIFTNYKFKVEDSVKNKYTEEIFIRLPGGKLGDISMNVTGVPLFKDNEEVVLFIEKENSDGYPILAGFYSGIYRVKTDSDGNKIVESPITGLSIINPISKQSNTSGEVTIEEFMYSLLKQINKGASNG